jgi:hypothetical protein
MSNTKRWNVDIFIDEFENKTRAEAKLVKEDKTQFSGVGLARKNPSDVNVPEIGDELAAARALSDLAHQLLHVAAQDIESMTHQPAHLDR